MMTMIRNPHSLVSCIMYKYVIVLYFLLSSSSSWAGEIAKTIQVCGDGAEWPPYIYWERVKTKKTNKLVGHTVEFLTEALKKHGISVKFNIIPWKRCLHLVEEGEIYSLALDASFSEERNRKFLLTDHYYEVTPMLFYFKGLYPKAFPHFSNASELFELGNICGLSGYNYEGMMKGLKNRMLDLGTKDFASVIKKTRNKDCIAFLGRYEVLKGFQKLGMDFSIDNEILPYKIPGAKKEKFYMLISRKITFSKKLKLLLDKEIRNVKKKQF